MHAYKRTSIRHFRIKATPSNCVDKCVCSLSDCNTMSAIELCIHDKRYKVKRAAEGRGYVSNCTLKFLHAVHAGEKSGFIGLATHRSGTEK